MDQSIYVAVKCPREIEMNTEIEATKRDILHWMLEMIDDDGSPYTSSDVEECGTRLGNFVDVIANSDEQTDFERVKSRVKALVLALNDFNE